MEYRPQILDNYPHQRHFLQLVNIPAFGTPFLFVKNHKAASTTVMATLLEHLLRQNGESSDAINMRYVHNPPRRIMLSGPRCLTVPQVMEALADKQVFRFTVVRDPVARTVSAYSDKFLKGEKQKVNFMRHLKRPAEDDISLSEFLDVLAHDEKARDIDRHWRPQRKEISYDFINYDFIGDMAHLDSATNYVLRRLFGPGARQMQDTRKSLGHQSPSREMIRQLTKTDLRNIETAFAGDFDMYEDVRSKLALVA